MAEVYPIKLDPRARDITGEKWGRLTALMPVGKENRSVVWLLECVCGNRIERRLPLLQLGKVQSCGCLRSDTCAARNRTHGEATRENQSKEYRTWAVMIRRCRDEKFQQYGDYGGRGIRVCDQWTASFDAFVADMGRAPSPQHTLDRLDPNGNYEPENCRWATSMEQGCGRRNNRVVEFQGRSLTVSNWSRETGIPKGVIAYRLDRGWSIEDTLTTPARRLKFQATPSPTGPERSRSKEYCCWSHMLRRCYDPKTKRYPSYGGRGIEVCQSWQDSFDQFLTDLGPAPTPRHSLDRIDNNGNYCPENCRWVLNSQQATNKRNNRNLTLNGETMCVAEWARRIEIPAATILARLRYGWSNERALTTPLRLTRRD